MEPAKDDTLARAITGDRDALVGLLKRYAPAARGTLAGRIPNRWQAVLSEDDVMQQTYADAARSISAFGAQSESSFAKWLNTAAEHNLLDALKMLEAEKRGGDRRPAELLHGGDTHVALVEMLAKPGTTPSGQAARREAITALEQAIEQLPDAYERVVVMYDLEQRPIEEVAAALSRSPGAVYMLRARAHDRLREIMGRTTKFFTSSS